MNPIKFQVQTLEAITLLKDEIHTLSTLISTLVELSNKPIEQPEPKSSKGLTGHTKGN